MVVSSPERNKPFKCKTILLFCPLDWELTEIRAMGIADTQMLLLLRSFRGQYCIASGWPWDQKSANSR